MAKSLTKKQRLCIQIRFLWNLRNHFALLIGVSVWKIGEMGVKIKIRFIRNLSKRNSSAGEWREEEPGEPSDHEVDHTSVKVVREGRGFG